MPLPDDRPPRVSVVMPVYNTERFVAEAVASVLRSRLTDLELIVIDDGCTDRSIAEVQRAAAGDARVRVVAGAHAGIAAARNVALGAARGEFIANLDADDAMYPDRLTRQVAYLDRHPECVAVGSRALVVNASGDPIRVGVRWFSHEEIDRAHLEGRGGAIWNPTATFRTAAARAIGGYNDHLTRTGEDHDLWLRLAETGRVVNLPQVLTRYRMHDANASLSSADRERRHAVTAGILGAACARRRMGDRQPVRVEAPPLPGWQRRTNAALLHYFSGRRRRAVLPALAAVALAPASPVAREALRVILAGPAPAWRA